MKKQNGIKLIDTENKLMVANWEEDIKWVKNSEGIKMYKLPVIKAVMLI